MTENSVKRLALVLAVQSEIEGMKVLNAERVSNGMAPAWNEQAFNQKAEELRSLA